jgi:hypothetical protein
MGGHDGEAATRIQTKDAAQSASRLQPGETIELPGALFLHLFVPAVRWSWGRRGGAGYRGAGRFSGTGGQDVIATEPAEILTCEMHAAA